MDDLIVQLQTWLPFEKTATKSVERNPLPILFFNTHSVYSYNVNFYCLSRIILQAAKKKIFLIFNQEIYMFPQINGF